MEIETGTKVKITTVTTKTASVDFDDDDIEAMAKNCLLEALGPPIPGHYWKLEVHWGSGQMPSLRVTATERLNTP